jgi:hypothetical protein
LSGVLLGDGKDAIAGFFPYSLTFIENRHPAKSGSVSLTPALAALCPNLPKSLNGAPSAKTLLSALRLHIADPQPPCRFRRCV